MNNIFSYICCLGRSEKTINWNQLNPDQENFNNYKTEQNSSTSCSQRQKNITISNNKSPQKWDDNDDQELLNLYKKFPGNFKAIQQNMSNRKTKAEIQQRYKKLSNNKQRHMWSQEEDKILLELYQQYGNNWQNIAFYLKERTGKQVRDRYINILDPEINKGQWTIEEDRIILQQFELLGPKWSKISTKLKGRPENMIKNRWYSYIKKRIDSFKNQQQQQQQENQTQQNQNQDRDQDCRQQSYLHDDFKFQIGIDIDMEQSNEICDQQNASINCKEEFQEISIESNELGKNGKGIQIQNVDIQFSREENNEQNQDFQFNQQMEIENEIQNQSKQVFDQNQKIISKNNLLQSNEQLQNNTYEFNNQFCSLYPKNYLYQQPENQNFQ